MELTKQQRRELEQAVERLESPGVVAQVADYLGKPLEAGLQQLPAGAGRTISRATTAALRQALAVAVKTLPRGGQSKSRDRLHKLTAAGIGGVGGAFGLFALPIELPLSTIVMLRSIADIARAEGEDLADLETRLACLEVFALGGRSSGGDSVEAGYLGTRAALAKTTSDAARYIARRGVTGGAAAPIARFISTIGSRFNVAVSEKLVAQAIPAVGAIGGASVNLLFINHFQQVARGHFVIRRLEREHGTEAVSQAYESIRARLAASD